MTETFFLRPNNEIQSQHLLKKIILLLEKAKHVRLCMAYFTNESIANAIIARINSSRPTQIIVNLADILRPETANVSEIRISKALIDILNSVKHHTYEEWKLIQIRTLGREVNDMSHMHHKFVICDDVVGLGSLNFTNHGFSNNYENFCLLKESAVIQMYTNEFEELWKMGEDLISDGAKVRSIECPRCKSKSGVDFESWGAACINCGHKFKMTK